MLPRRRLKADRLRAYFWGMDTKEIRSPAPKGGEIVDAQSSVIEVLEGALDDLKVEAKTYVQNARTPATLRGYDAAWSRFVSWCSIYRKSPLPADPTTVALFLTDVSPTKREEGVPEVPTSTGEKRLHAGTLSRYTSAIKLRHEAAGHLSPTLDVRVKSVLRGIRRAHGVAPNRQAAPLLVGDLISVVETLDATKLIDVRNKALLLVGFAGALRRSEIVSLQVGDLDFRNDGVVVKLRRRKTDQEGKGAIVGIAYGTNGTCPVVSLRKWLAAAGIEKGPAFRGVDRHGNVSSQRLNPQAVCRIVKKLVPRAGLAPGGYSGHSLRAGFATSAAAVGVEERDIAKVTGHASLQVLRQYIRDGQVLDGDLSRRLGL